MDVCISAEDVGVGPSAFADGAWECAGVGNAELDGEGKCDVIDDAARSSEERLDCPPRSCAKLAGIGDGGTLMGEGGVGISADFFLNILPNSFRAPERSDCGVGVEETAAGIDEGCVGVD